MGSDYINANYLHVSTLSDCTRWKNIAILKSFFPTIKEHTRGRKICLVCGFIFLCRDGRKRTCTFQPKVGKRTYNGCGDKHTCKCVSVCVLCDILSHCDRSYKQDYGRLLAHGVGTQTMHHCHADQVCGGREGEWTYGGKIWSLQSRLSVPICPTDKVSAVLA